MKKDTWLLVANGSVARLFKINNKHSLSEVTILEHPESHLRTRDLVTDTLGRDFESNNPTRHAMEPKTTPKQQEFIDFARRIASYLEEARINGKYEHLYLVAGPSLLGLLRQELTAPTSKLIKGEANKDLTHLPTHELSSHFSLLF